MRILMRIATAASVLFAAALVHADYQRGKAAEDRWNYAEAEGQYLERANAGDRVAMRALALLYLRQARGSVNHAKLAAQAVPYLTRAAGLGDAPAQARLATELLADPKLRRPESSVGGVLPGVESSIPRGLELLRASCKGGVEHSCLRLASIYSGAPSERFLSSQVPADRVEATRWAALAEPALRRRAELGDPSVMQILSEDRPWSGVISEERLLFGLLAAYARGATGADVLKRATEAQALEQSAAQWEGQRRLRPESFDADAMSKEIVAALERGRGNFRERAAAEAGLNAAIAVAAGAQGKDARYRKTLLEGLTAQLTPIFEDYLRGLDELASHEGLDYRNWMAAEIRRHLTPRQLYFLSSFFAKETGRKLIDNRLRMQRMRGEALKLSLIAGADTSGTQRGGAEHHQRLVGFAKQIGAHSDLDPWRDGGYERAGFALKGGLTFPGADAYVASKVIPAEYLVMLGRDYETLSRSFTNAQMNEVLMIELSDAWKSVLTVAQAREDKLKALPATIKLRQALSDRAGAVLKR